MATSVVSVSPASTAANYQPASIVLYFLIAYLGTWLLFIPMILDTTLSPDIFGILFVLSTFTGPTLAAIAVTFRTKGWQGVRTLFGGLLRWRVNIVWYIAALFSFMIVWVGGYSIAFGGAPVRALIAQPQLLLTVFLPFILTVSFIPALGEEIGWRGFALPELQKRYGPVKGTLILGVLHSVWHLPAFFSPVLGPFMPVGFLTFVITGVAGTFIYTWIFNNTRQSLLIAVIVHAAGNGASAMLGMLLADQMPSSELFLTLIMSGWFNPILFSIVAAALIIVTRGRLSYKPSQVDV